LENENIKTTNYRKMIVCIFITISIIIIIIVIIILLLFVFHILFRDPLHIQIYILHLGAFWNEPREFSDCITYPRVNESLLGCFSTIVIYFITLIGLLL